MERTPGRAELRIQLLGAFRVWVGGQLIPETAWRRRKAASLLKLLALAPEHRLHREEVLELLWAELAPEPAQNNLHRTLHLVRHALEPDRPPGQPSPYLCLQGELVVLCPAAELQVDVDAFIEAATAARKTQDPARAEQAIALYVGDLLPEDQYEDWAEGRREELRRLYHDLLRQLSRRNERRKQYRQAIAVLQRLVGSEPAEEGAHLELMRLYALSGQRHEALQQYDRLLAALHREVDAEPDAPTRRFYHEIRTGRFPPESPVTATDASSVADFAPAGSSGADGVSAPVGQVPPPGAHSSAVASPPTNLPCQLSSFVGREQDIAEVKRLLSSIRLLTLTGAGGVGKSRLALEVAAELQHNHPDGVWLVQLAALSDARLLPQTVAGTLGLREQPNRPITEALVDFLRLRELLLVLDNCEHLLAVCGPLTQALLGSCPDLRILATSRRALGMSGEVAWRVPSLAIPDAADPPALDSLPRSDAVSLFLERTRSARPDFRLTPENAPAAVEVCRRLEGIPLAIELAAARMRVLTVEQLAARLDDCFAVLGGGSTSRLDRHRTLRATMDWSHGLLSEPERVLFRRLAVFRGGWTLEAVEGVCSGEGIEEGEILELLSELVDHSLVMVAKQGAAMRYRLLEPVRQYAEEKLREAGEAEEVRRPHAEWYLGLAERAEPELTGPDQAGWLDRLEEDHYNFQAAIAWSLERGDVGFQLRMAGALRLYWSRRGYADAWSWLEGALAAGTNVAPETRARALQAAAPMVQLKDPARGIELREEALALWRELGNRREIVRTLNNLGEMEWEQGTCERARRLLTEALTLARGLEERDRFLVAVILHTLGQVALHERSYDEAEAWLTESLSVSRDAEHQEGIGCALHGLAQVALRQGDVGAARTLAGEGLVLFRSLAYRPYIAYCLEVLAEVEAATGQAIRAVWLWGKAAALRAEAFNFMPRSEQPEYERCLAAARAQLGSTVFDKAWAEGQGMTLDHAITCALSAEGAAAAELREVAHLSDREHQVAALIVQGLSNRQIAGELGILEGTAAVHVHNILKKLGLASRKNVTSWAAGSDLVPPQAGQEGGVVLTRTAAEQTGAPPAHQP